jgi:hypothetical protein
LTAGACALLRQLLGTKGSEQPDSAPSPRTEQPPRAVRRTDLRFQRLGAPAMMRLSVKTAGPSSQRNPPHRRHIGRVGSAWCSGLHTELNPPSPSTATCERATRPPPRTLGWCHPDKRENPRRRPNPGYRAGPLASEGAVTACALLLPPRQAASFRLRDRTATARMGGMEHGHAAICRGRTGAPSARPPRSERASSGLLRAVLRVGW